MRLILVSIVVLIGVNLGHNVIQTQYEVKERKLQQWCEVDKSYCATTESVHNSPTDLKSDVY